MSIESLSDARRTLPRLDLFATQGGRHGRCWIAECTAEVAPGPATTAWRSAAAVLHHPLFHTLPTTDRELVRTLALQATTWPLRSAAR